MCAHGTTAALMLNFSPLLVESTSLGSFRTVSSGVLSVAVALAVTIAASSVLLTNVVLSSTWPR